MKIYKHRNILGDQDQFGGNTEDGLEDERWVREIICEDVALTQVAYYRAGRVVMEKREFTLSVGCRDTGTLSLGKADSEVLTT